MRLGRLFSPQSVAVIGGGAWCRSVLEQIAKIGFAGPVWHVHPSADGAYRSVKDLPGAPDAIFLGVNRDATIPMVAALRDMGAGGAVCFAAGFSEMAAEDSKGPAREAELMAAAGEMPVLGPNCYGFINALDGALLWPDQHGCVPVARGVGLICQSSNVAINLTMQRRGLPIGMVATVGNGACVSLGEIGQAMLADDRVSALGLFVEGFGDVRELESLAGAARAAGKPIVALKLGASETAKAAAVSHTASLAGSDAGAAALMARLRIARAASLEVFLEALKVAHVFGYLPEASLACASCSGGEAGLAGDTGAALGLDFPPLEKAQIGGLRDALGPRIALANPLDYNTFIWNDVPAMTAAFAALGTGSQAVMAVVVDFPRPDRCDPSAWDCVTDAVKAASLQTGRRFALIASIAEGMPEPIAERLLAAGVLPMHGLKDAFGAVSVMSDTRWAAQEHVWVPQALGDGRVLPEAEAKALLTGLDVPRSERCLSGEDAGRAAQRLGFPVVLKGEGVAHKTEAGAVRLGLETTDAVASAASEMGAPGYLVEEMVTDNVAELLVGVVADPAHGYVLTLAAGGILTELMADRTCLLLPVREEDIRGALQRLRIAQVLAGYRGQAAADLDAVVAGCSGGAGFCSPPHGCAGSGDQPVDLRDKTGGSGRCADPPWGGCMSDDIRVEKRGAVFEVTLQRGKANAIDLATSRVMGEVFTEFRDDDAMRVAVLTGAGAKFFCPGWDLKAAADGDAVDGDYGVGGFGGLQELRGLNKPVICAVNGILLWRWAGTGTFLRHDPCRGACDVCLAGDPVGNGCRCRVDQAAEAHSVPYRHGDAADRALDGGRRGGAVGADQSHSPGGCPDG